MTLCRAVNVLRIVGGNSKRFLYPTGPSTEDTQAEDLSVTHSGIVSYQPSELVLSVRGATRLSEVHAALSEQKQMLGFEPPAFGEAASIGGTVAAALSGPARPYAGSIRDAVLGVKMLTGSGEVVRFGGEVMKNVAGYDVSRLVVGSMGSLGVILEVSLRVTPQFPACAYWKTGCNEHEAFEQMARFRKLSLPITGLAYDGQHLHLRLAGSEIAIEEASPLLEDFSPEDENFWSELNEQELAFFNGATNIWRVVVPFESVSGVQLPGDRFWDWGGGLCWLKSDESASVISRAANDANGSARLFRGGGVDDDQAIAKPIRDIRERLKHVFDPHNIFYGGGQW